MVLKWRIILIMLKIDIIKLWILLISTFEFSGPFIDLF